MFVSLAQTTSTFLAPSHSGTWGASGNQATCISQGIVGILGTVSTPFYSLMLCIYYLCVVKYSMRDEHFGQKVEKYLHAFIVFYSIATVTYIAGIRQLIHSNIKLSSWCYISPSGCDDSNPDVCTYGVDFKKVQWALIYAPCLLIFIAELTIMGMTCYTVYLQDKTMAQYSFRQQMVRRGEEEEEDSTRRASIARSRRFIEIRKQGMLYFAAVVLTYGGIMVKLAVDGIVGSSPFPLIVCSRSLYTLQGLFNICVYIRPQVASIRRQDPSLSIAKSFYIALMTVHISDNRQRMRRTSRHLSNLSISSFPRRRSSRRGTPTGGTQPARNLADRGTSTGATNSRERPNSSRNLVEKNVKFLPIEENSIEA